MGLQPSSHTPKLNQIEAGQSQPKKQSPVSGPICNHGASGQAIPGCVVSVSIKVAAPNLYVHLQNIDARGSFTKLMNSLVQPFARSPCSLACCAF